MTIVIIIITAITSILAFNAPHILYRYQFTPYQIVRRRQYIRILTHGFLHASWPHLLINMLVLFFFGEVVERYFLARYEGFGEFYFILMYLGAIIISPIYSLVKNRNNPYYNAVGASGAVSAVVFASIMLNPWSMIYFFGLIPIPGIIFGLAYLVYSWQMSKRSRDNIAHDTHFFGALFGIVYPILLDPGLLNEFVQQLLSFSF